MTSAGKTPEQRTDDLEHEASKRTQRLAAVATAVGATVAAWILIEVVGSVDLRSPGFEGNTGGFDIGVFAVVLTAGVGSLAAWGVLALVERFSSRPRRTWILLAGVGLLVSLGGPFSGTGLDTGDRLLLVLLHVVTAAVLIPMLARTITAAGRE